MPTAYLSSKVHNPTNHELGKLKRLVGYLKFRPKVLLQLNAESLVKDGVIHAYCDAAHAVHKPSLKSHLGCFISLGSGPVALKSVGAKRMSTSSTNSEILDEKRSRSDRTTGFVFNTLPSAKKKDYAKKKVISNDKATSDTSTDNKR